MRVKKQVWKKHAFFYPHILVFTGSAPTLSCLITALSCNMVFFKNPHVRTCLLILDRGVGREREGWRNISMREKHQLIAFCVCCDQRLNPQPRHVPCLGMEPTILQFVGWHPTNWVTLARAQYIVFQTFYMNTQVNTMLLLIVRPFFFT